MTHPSRHRRRSKLRSWYVWHRWLGVCAALFVLVLALSGILLNHTEALALDSRPVRSSAVLSWYGIEAPEPMRAYVLESSHLTQAGARWFLDGRALPGEFGPLRGAVSFHSMIVAATPVALLLLTGAGELAERMDERAGIPNNIRRIGIDAGGRPLIDTASGYYRGDDDLVQWHPVEAPAQARWSEPTPVPPVLRERIAHTYRGEGLPLERVILDLHSGRIFGDWGIYLMDGAAILLMLLAGSGIWLWLQGRLRQRRR